MQTSISGSVIFVRDREPLALRPKRGAFLGNRFVHCLAALRLCALSMTAGEHLGRLRAFAKHLSALSLTSLCALHAAWSYAPDDGAGRRQPLSGGEVIVGDSPEERASRTQGIAAGQYVWGDPRTRA